MDRILRSFAFAQDDGTKVRMTRTEKGKKKNPPVRGDLGGILGFFVDRNKILNTPGHLLFSLRENSPCQVQDDGSKLRMTQTEIKSYL